MNSIKNQKKYGVEVIRLISYLFTVISIYLLASVIPSYNSEVEELNLQRLIYLENVDSYERMIDKAIQNNSFYRLLEGINPAAKEKLKQFFDERNFAAKQALEIACFFDTGSRNSIENNREFTFQELVNKAEEHINSGKAYKLLIAEKENINNRIKKLTTLAIILQILGLFLQVSFRRKNDAIKS